MGLFDSGIVNFIKLLIIIGLISMLYMIVMQKIKEQNHKISSLLSLVSTMASEITLLKSPPECLEPKEYEKDDISNDSDSEVSYDSEDSEIDKGEKIEFFETNVIEIADMDMDVDDMDNVNADTETDANVFDLHSILKEEIITFQSEPEPEQPEQPEQNYKKLNTTELLQLAINRNLTTKEKGLKMKKKELLSLF
jgi:ABC-type antimicrobial peptide transport system permease subunit